MVKRLTNRFFRMRFLSGVFVSLPILFLAVWYSSSAYLRLRTYAEAVDDTVVSPLELFHIQFHDLLTRDIRWIARGNHASKAKIPVMTLEISHNNMVRLYESGGNITDRPYVEGKLATSQSDVPMDVNVRMRGSRHWHYLSRKKSLKVQVLGNQAYKGYRTFNLINQATPLVVGEKVISDIARDNGVLSPSYQFVRLVLNGEDLGVYHLQAQVDESLFLKNEIIQSALYSGNLSKKDDMMALWRDAALWKQVAEPLHESKSYRLLKTLLHQVTDASYADFWTYASSHIDLDAFAAFEAVDVVFGIEQHGFMENQKLLYDAYTGKWKPIAWDLRGFKHDAVVNRVENPIWLRLKMYPQYRTLRDRAVWELLENDASPAAVAKRLARIRKDLGDELASDRLFQAYKLLPKIDKFSYKMLRPMNVEKWRLVIQDELRSFTRRHAFLRDAIGRSQLYYQLGTSEPLEHSIVEGQTSVLSAQQPVELNLDADNAVVGYETPLTIVVGAAAMSVERIVPRFENCDTPEYRIIQDDKERSLPILLASSALLTRREKGDDDLNNLQIETRPFAQTVLLRSRCKPVDVDIEAVNQTRGNRVMARAASAEEMALAVVPRSDMNRVPSFEFEQPSIITPIEQNVAMEEIVVGPGEITVDATKVYSENTRVVVKGDTVFKMAKGTSLIFNGPVLFDGSDDHPIQMVPKGKKAFGGLAVVGPRTNGAIIKGLVVKGGSAPRTESVHFPAMINVHNTSDVTVEGCFFLNNRKQLDGFHAAYVDNLRVVDVTVQDIEMDAIDIEFCSGIVARSRVFNAGDDGIDLMRSELRIVDTLVDGARQHGISVGEKTRVSIENSLVRDCENGVFVKDASRVYLARNILAHHQIGILVDEPNWRYEGANRVSAEALYVVASEQAVRRADGVHKLNWGQVHHSLLYDLPLASFASSPVLAAPYQALQREVHNEVAQ